MKPTVAIVVAVARNGVIGKNGGLPWRLSSDLKAFRRLTMGKPIIMGRRTFQSIGKALDGRDNIVVTSNEDFKAPGVHVAASVNEALAIAKRCALDRKVNEVMIIGGAKLYADTLPLTDRLYWTEVDAEVDGDVSFPPLNWDNWRLVSREINNKTERDDFHSTMSIFDRIHQ